MVRTERRWFSSMVISALADVMVVKGVSEHLRSDNGPEFVARDLRQWLAKNRRKDVVYRTGSLWENGYCESFNSKLRNEFLNGEIFYSMKEMRVLAERWRVHYNTVRPHSSLGYRPPAPGVAGIRQNGAWRSGNRYALPLLISPGRRLLELRNSYATLTRTLEPRIGHSTRLENVFHRKRHLTIASAEDLTVQEIRISNLNVSRIRKCCCYSSGTERIAVTDCEIFVV
jgi:putative transposase